MSFSGFVFSGGTWQGRIWPAICIRMVNNTGVVSYMHFVRSVSVVRLHLFCVFHRLSNYPLENAFTFSFPKKFCLSFQSIFYF